MQIYFMTETANCIGGFSVIKTDTHLGTIELSSGYLSALIGHTVTSCFGVVRMNPAGATQGVRTAVLRSEAIDNGVRVYTPKESSRLCIDLHITVMYGVNVAAITDSIMNKVRYVVGSETGLEVSKVNVFVDAMENS